MKSLLISLLALAMSFNAQAAQSLSTKVNNSYNSIRALGMGNAFTAVADDYSLIMYNPAGFARKQQNEVQVTLVGAGVSSKTLTVANDVSKAADTVGTDNDKAAAISAVLEKYYGESLGGKLQAVEMFWVRKGWGFAILPADLTIDMTINKQLGPAIDLNVKGDSIVAFGMGREINKYLDAGITIKGTHRVSVEQSVSAFELASDPNVLSDNRFKEGTNFDFDVGVSWRPNWFNSKTVEIEPAKTEVVTPPADAPKEEAKEEVKPEDKKVEAVGDEKTDEKKTDEKKDDKDKKEEERKPQAEDEAKEVQVAGENDKAAEAKTEEALKKDLAEKEKTDKKTKKDKKADKKTAEVKPEDKKVDEPKAEVKVVEAAKTEDQPVAESEERFPLTLAMVMHNSLDGNFSLSKMVNKNATEVPTKMYRVIDVGSQYMLRDGEDFKIRAMLDFKNILHPDITLNKSTHFGIEFDFSPSTWFKTQLRGGMNQMYYTAGATFLFGIFNIDVVTYGEEVGSTSQKIENRVLAAKLALNF